MAFAGMAALFLGACAAPIQNGGVYVMAGAGDRFELLCKFRKGGGGEESADMCMPAGEQQARPARVYNIVSDSHRLKGSQAKGGPGDFVLENDEVVFVIGRIEIKEGQPASGGYLIDAADARTRHDELGAFIPWHGAAAPNAQMAHIVSGTDEQGRAYIDVLGRDQKEPQLIVHTRYSLGPGDRAIVLTTEIQNQSEKAIGPIDLSDRIQWGSTGAIIPGQAPDADLGDQRSMYIGGLGKDISYLIAPVSDSDILSSTTDGQSELIFERNAMVPPGAAVRYERVVSLAPRGDPVAVANEFFYLQGGAPGGLMVQLLDENKNPLAVSADSRIVLQRISSVMKDEKDTASSWVDTWWMNSSRENPNDSARYILGGELPPGRYMIQYDENGTRRGEKTAAEIKSGELSRVALVIPAKQKAVSMAQSP